MYSLPLKIALRCEREHRIINTYKIIKYFHSVMSNSWSSWAGKSSVRMTIDFPCNPALKAMNFSSLNLLSMMPGRPSSAAKGGTAPGSTPSFLTSSSLHMRLFLANSSTLRSLLQLIFRFARYSSRQIDSFPFTSIVLEPHSSGVLRSSADSLEVRVAACYMSQNLMDLAVRQATILLYTCESYCWASGSSCYFSIMQQSTQIWHKRNHEFSLKRVRFGSVSLKERLVVDLELFLSENISLKEG